MKTLTARVEQLGQAPARRTLLGDPKRPESAQHVIEFPGGAIAVTRLSDGSGYWAEITVNTQPPVPGVAGLHGATGAIDDTRLAYAVDGGRVDRVSTEHLVQVAVLVREVAGVQ